MKPSWWNNYEVSFVMYMFLFKASMLHCKMSVFSPCQWHSSMSFRYLQTAWSSAQISFLDTKILIYNWIPFIMHIIFQLMRLGMVFDYIYYCHTVYSYPLCYPTCLIFYNLHTLLCKSRVTPWNSYGSNCSRL